MRPNFLVVRTFLVRGALLWLAARAMITTALLLDGASPFRLSGAAIAEVILLSVALCFLETHLRRERALLENLGIRRLTLGVVFAGPALVGELALRVGATVFQ
jgi:hypothetical protein